MTSLCRESANIEKPADVKKSINAEKLPNIKEPLGVKESINAEKPIGIEELVVIY